MNAFWSPAPILVAGPCVLEGDDINLTIATRLAELHARLGLRVVYKASFDKANRSREGAPRGPGLERGLAQLAKVRSESGLPILTDIHEPAQASAAAAVADALQIPAFLCRQTDLLHAVGATGKPANVKKGQWASPDTMVGALEKLRTARAGDVAITERGTFFGYADLVVDMRSFARMKHATGVPVLFDATHAVQRPGAGHRGSAGGSPADVPALLCAAAAAGADGFFLETHPDPATAPSDGATMWPLDRLEDLVERAVAVWHVAREKGAMAKGLLGFAGLVLLGLLGSGCSETGQPPTRLAAPDSADQVLWGMSQQVTVEGLRRARVFADTAYFYQGPQTYDLVGVKVEFYSPEGDLASTVTADSGTYDVRSRDMEGRGHVVAVTPDGRKLTTTVLRYDRQIDKISGPEPFVFDAPDRHLEGAAFTADTDFKNVEATNPRAGRAKQAEIHK